MTKEEIEEAKASIEHAEALLSRIAHIRKREENIAFLSMREGTIAFPAAEAEAIIAAGLKALREQAEKELAALRFGSTKSTLPPFVWPPPTIVPHAPFVPTEPNPLRPIYDDKTHYYDPTRVTTTSGSNT